MPISKRFVPLAHRSGFRTKIGPEPGVWKAWVGRRGLGQWLETYLLFSEEAEMARRRADEVGRWVVLVVTWGDGTQTTDGGPGHRVWSEEFATAEAAEQCRLFFESVEGARIKVIEDVAG